MAVVTGAVHTCRACPSWFSACARNVDKGCALYVMNSPAISQVLPSISRAILNGIRLTCYSVPCMSPRYFPMARCQADATDSTRKRVLS